MLLHRKLDLSFLLLFHLYRQWPEAFLNYIQIELSELCGSIFAMFQKLVKIKYVTNDLLQSLCWDCHRWDMQLYNEDYEFFTEIRELYTSVPFDLKIRHFANEDKEDEDVISADVGQVNQLRCHPVYGRPSVSDLSW